MLAIVAKTDICLNFALYLDKIKISMIKVSDTASKKIIEMMKDDGFDAAIDYVRVGVKSGGCCILILLRFLILRSTRQTTHIQTGKLTLKFLGCQRLMLKGRIFCGELVRYQSLAAILHLSQRLLTRKLLLLFGIHISQAPMGCEDSCSIIILI